MMDIVFGEDVPRTSAPRTSSQEPVGSLQTESSACMLAGWVGETLLSAERAAAGSPDALSMFWIRLYGVLTDLADFVALTLEDPAGADGMCVFPLARGTAQVSPLPLAMARLRGAFEEDELLYIEYRRHAECDPFQARYRAGRRHGGAALVPSALLGGRPVTGQQAELAFQRLFARSGDASSLGSELSRRSLVPLRSLQAAASTR